MDMEMIMRLQDNLSIIRRIVGWTTEELGKRIGVTKQTISNLEDNKTRMTLTQYIAIRTILDYEIQTKSENVLYVSEHDNLEIKKMMETIAAAIDGGADPEVLQNIMSTFLKGSNESAGC